MNWIKTLILSNLTKAILRHALGAGGAWIVSKGILSNSDAEQALGALAVLGAVGHSLWDKRAVIVAEIKTLLQSSKSGAAAILVLLVPLGLGVVGCKSSQIIDNESGSGFTANIPVGFSGNNVFELNMKVGTFKHTTAIQPVYTNKDGTIVTPTLVVVANTRGKFDANALGSTNPAAGATGGDSYVIATGQARAGVTNSDLYAQAGYRGVSTNSSK